MQPMAPIPEAIYCSAPQIRCAPLHGTPANLLLLLHTAFTHSPLQASLCGQ